MGKLKQKEKKVTCIVLLGPRTHPHSQKSLLPTGTLSPAKLHCGTSCHTMWQRPPVSFHFLGHQRARLSLRVQFFQLRFDSTNIRVFQCCRLKTKSVLHLSTFYDYTACYLTLGNLQQGRVVCYYFKLIPQHPVWMLSAIVHKRPNPRVT